MFLCHRKGIFSSTIRLLLKGLILNHFRIFPYPRRLREKDIYR